MFVARTFRGIGERERLQRGLRHRIAAPERRVAARGAGGDEQRAARIGGAQQRIEGADQPPVRGDVHVEEFLEQFRLEMRQRRHRAEHTGIAEKGVEPAPALIDRGAEAIERCEIFQIERNERGAAAGFLDFVVDIFEPADRARDEDDMRAGSRERLGRRLPDAARRAGDERNAPFERFRHGIRRRPRGGRAGCPSARRSGRSG